MTHAKKQHYEGDEDVIRRNIEGSQELIEKRRKAVEDEDTEQPITAAQPEYDQELPPGQTDVPLGGTSNPNVEGGTANRHKRG